MMYFFAVVLVFFVNVTFVFATPPVIVQIVTSLACPHCAQNADTTKAFIDDYTEKGLITPIWVDYPSDIATLAATKLSWSLGHEKRYALYRKLLERQGEWHNSDWRVHLKKIAFELGLNDATLKECFEDDTENERKIIDTMQRIVKKHKLQFVPVLIVSDRFVIDVTKEALDKALEKIKKFETFTS